MRKAFGTAMACLMTIAAAVADPAQAAVRMRTEIPEQRLDDALRTLANQRGIQLVYLTDSVQSLRTAGAVGDFTVSEALTRLLSGSGLEYKYVDDKTISIFSSAHTTSRQQGSLPSSGGSFRVAQAADSTPTADASSMDPQVEEVIVSAQKRMERLQDVPVPVSVLKAQSLAANNQVRLRDYYTSVPGLSVLPTPAAGMPQQIAMRGITTGDITATVGIVIDDVPYGSPASFGAAQHAIPDLDPSDLSHIEVLRGPQGTLYGASSLGGLLKFVTTDPSTNAFGGRVQVGANSVRNADDLGMSARGSVNLPLSDTVAVRASGFTREDPGYIDNPRFNLKGVNETSVRGGRLSGLWQPNDDVSLKLSALYQRTVADGSSNVDILPGLGELQQSYFPGVGAYETKVRAYSAIVNAQVAGVEIASITGYNLYTAQDSLDFTTSLGAASQTQFGAPNALIFTGRETDKVTQELRFSASLNEKVEWFAGGFYTKEDTDVFQDFFAASASGEIAGQWAHRPYPFTYEEYAAFADLTYHFSERFDIQVGARQSHIEQSVKETWIGPYAPRFLGSPSPLVRPEQDTSSSPFTYLVTPRWKIAPDLMVYARFASGFRPGNVNLATAAAGVPLEFDPDMTQNYELGLKGKFFDSRLAIDASLYYIDWKDIQLRLTNPQTNIGYTTNGGEARSQGVELSVDLRPFPGTTISAWAAYNDATLSQDFEPTSPVYGVSGDRLPNSSRLSGHLSLQQEFPLWGTATGYVGGAVNYIGNRLGKFRGLSGGVPLPRTDFPAYATADLRGGVEYGYWSASAFINNLADKRAITAGGVDAFPPFAFTYVQPRTIGVSLAKSF